MSEMSDFTVEVRDRNFVRQGQIAPEYTDLKFLDVHNGVGSWELKLPAEHPRLDDLRAKGSGIVVTEHWVEGGVHKYRVFSGRMRTARLSQDATDPAGTWVFTGVDDNVVAAATRVYPDPAHAADAQVAAYWEGSGAAETVMKSAVSLNAGAGAIVSRRYSWLTVPASAGLGGQVKCSSRFDVLGDLLTSLGTAGGLGWEFRQAGAGVTFSVYEPQDKTGSVRLDIRNGGIQSNELGYSAPSASEVLVLGQGQGEERTVLRVTSAPADAEVAAWGLRWEQVKDQRNTDDPAELAQAGAEVLAEQGATVNSLKVVPSDAPGMRLGRDWYRGDRITVVVDGQEAAAVVTQVAVSISSAGVIRQATVGDPVGFSFEAKLASKVSDVEQRVGQVERLVGQGVDWADVANKPAAFPTTWALLSDGYTDRGTAAQRDARFGVPATDAARVALANKRVQWFNTEKGYYESYYALASLAGLAVPGLGAPGSGYVAPASGWYPAPGALAYMTRIKNNSFQSAAGGVFTQPTLLGAGASAYAHVGSMFSASGNAIIIPSIAGLFDVTASIYWSGGGAMNYTILSVRYTGGSEQVTSVRAYGAAADMQQVAVAPGVYCWAGQGIELEGMPAGNHNFYGDGVSRRTFLTLKYAGPPLIT